MIDQVSCNLNCGSNASCVVSSHIAECTCENGFQPNPDAATGCVTCTDDSHCSGGQACQNNDCVTTCSSDSDCAGTESCTNNICVQVK